MELNWAQLLVHDDSTIKKFKRDHSIPNDVMIERLRPKKKANTIKGEGNRILVHIWLIN